MDCARGKRGFSIYVTLFVTLFLLIAGCIPTNIYDARSRRNVAEDKVSNIVPGKTTMEVVLLALGEPDCSSPNGLHFVYSAARLKWLGIIGGYGGVLPVGLGKNYLIIIDFDDRNIVASREYKENWDLDWQGSTSKMCERNIRVLSPKQK